MCSFIFEAVVAVNNNSQLACWLPYLNYYNKCMPRCFFLSLCEQLVFRLNIKIAVILPKLLPRKWTTMSMFKMQKLFYLKWKTPVGFSIVTLAEANRNCIQFLNENNYFSQEGQDHSITTAFRERNIMFKGKAITNQQCFS